MDASGRYLIQGEIGEGGFATVYRAWDALLHRETALKALLPHLATNAEVRARFIGEARALASLQHPNIVRFFDVDETHERPYFTMELVDGPSLALVVQGSGPLPLPDAVRHIRALASAVDYLHAAGIVHRDIKPANVMLDRDGRTVLMDFGIARALDASHHTRTGAVLGTVEYMSPEQVRGLPVTAASDVYALGVLTYYLLAGSPPYEGDTAFVLHAHAYEPPPPLSSRAAGLPAVVYHAIDAALAKDPAARPPSATAFVDWLTGTAVPVLPRRPVAASKHRRGALMGGAIGGGALLAGALVAGLLLGRDAGARAPVATLSGTSGIGGASVASPPGAVSAEQAQPPLALTEFTVYDNIFSLQSGAFVPGESVVACVKLAQPRSSEFLRFVILPAELAPTADVERQAVAHVDGVRAADGCAALPLRQEMLRPGDYRAWAIYRNEPINSSRFRILEPPPPATPEPPPPTPSPSPVMTPARMPSPTVAPTVPAVATPRPPPPPTQRIPDAPPSPTPPPPVRTGTPVAPATAQPTPSPTPVRTPTPAPTQPPTPPPPPPTPMRPVQVTVSLSISPSTIAVGGQVTVCANVSGYAALRFSVVAPFSQFLGEAATGSSHCLTVRAPSAGSYTIVVEAYESGRLAGSASASFSAR